MQGLIAGYIALDGGGARADLVDAMLDAMTEQGLQSKRQSAQCGAAAFGAVTLAPAKGAAPAAPCLVADEHWITVADIRLYGAGADTPQRHLMRALADHSDAAVGALHGDFAVARWNASTATLSLLRDHFGARPLQYTVQPGRYVAFASVPWALLRTGLASNALDDRSMTEFPFYGAPRSPNTTFRDIKVVRAAHAVTVTARHVRERRVWRQPLPPLLSADANQDAIAIELRRLFEQAVRRRLPAAGPGAAHLSGGLDSTPIAVMASRALAERSDPLHAYTIREVREPGLEPTDETPHVNETAAREGNLILHGFHPNALDSKLHATANAETMQSFHPDVIEERFLSDVAHHGASTILSGWGGDECVTFRMRFHGEPELFWKGQWRALGTRLRKSTGRQGFGLIRPFLTRVLYRSLPESWRLVVQRLRGRAEADAISDIMAMIPAANRKRIVHTPRPVYWNTQKMRRAALEDWWIESTLERFAQRGARHGVLYAYPMLDRDLVDYAMRIPGALLYDGNRIRALYRKAIADLVPHSVLYGDDKMVALPAESLRTARAKPWLQAEAQRLSALPLVRRYVDMDAMTQSLALIPDPARVIAAINGNDKEADAILAQCLSGGYALQLAHFLEHHLRRQPEAANLERPSPAIGRGIGA